ncbi:hypothetical protein AB0I02_37170 [Streptomyces phaeochromogenes]
MKTSGRKIEAGARLDGKYLRWSSGPKLSAEDIACGCRQLLEVERGWRDMKSVPGLRPVCRRLEDRVRARVFLCRLALLLIRVAENAAAATWPELRRRLDRVRAGTFTGPTGVFRQRTELGKPRRDLFAKLGVIPPKQIIELTSPAP